MNVKAKIRHFFLAGILVVLPTFITFYIFLFFFNKIGNVFRLYVTPILEYFGLGCPPLYIYSIFGFLIIIIFTLIIGIIATNFIGRKIVKFGEQLLARIPFLSKIYIAAKQLLEAVAFKEKDAFRHMVMIEYPRKGIYSLGFMTAKTQSIFKKQIDSKNGEDFVNVFVPTTPNPTSGMLVIIPQKDIIPLDIPVEDGLKFIVSGGIVYSANKENNET